MNFDLGFWFLYHVGLLCMDRKFCQNGHYKGHNIHKKSVACVVKSIFHFGHPSNCHQHGLGTHRSPVGCLPMYLTAVTTVLPNIVRSFRWHSAVAARLTSEQPDNVIPVSKILTFCQYNHSLLLCMFLEWIEDVWWCKCSVLPLISLPLHIVQISRK